MILDQLSPWHATNIYSFAAKQIEHPDDLPEYITHLSEGTASYEQQIRDAWQNLKDHPTEANANAFIQLMLIYSKDLWPEVLANVLGINVDDLTSEQLDLLNEKLTEHHNYITTSLAPDIIRFIKDGKDLSSLDHRTSLIRISCGYANPNNLQTLPHHIWQPIYQ